MSSKNVSKQDTSDIQITEKKHAIFAGFSAKGSVKITLQNREAYGYGTLYEIKKKSGDSETGNVRVRRHITPLPPREEMQEKMRLVCERTEKKYLLIGSVKWVTKDAEQKSETPKIGKTGSLTASQIVSANTVTSLRKAKISSNLKSSEPQSSSIAPAAIEVKGNPAPSVSSKLSFPISDIQNELERISLQAAAGITPYVKLRLVCFLTNESRANIYRKIHAGNFPPPVKRGKGSFWPLPAIEAYKSGIWSAGD